MKRFPLRVLSAERAFYEGDCTSLIVPAFDGLYGIQANHEDAVLAVVPGTLLLRTGAGEERRARVSDGLVKVERGEVLVLVETAEAL